MLTLYEEITLLSLDPATEKFPRSSPELHYCITSAILVELTTQQRIRKSADGTMEVFDRRLTGDPILDDAMTIMMKSRRLMDAKHWIMTLTRIRSLLSRVIDSLVAKGAVSQRKKTVFLFTLTRYQVVNPGLIHTLKHRIRIIDEAARNERTACIIGLVLGGERILSHLFSKEEWSDLKARFQHFISTHPLPAAVKDVLYQGSSDDLTAVLLLTTMTAVDAGGDGGSDGGGDGGD
jgi:hypothetical protein